MVPRVVLVVALVVAAALLAGAALLAWSVAERMLVPVPNGLQSEFAVLGFEGDGSAGVVRLPLPPPRPSQFSRTGAEGRYGLVWQVPGGIGHGRLGPVNGRGDGWLERPLDVVVGPPPAPGTPARLDVTLHRRDPLADHGVPFEEVRIAGPVGDIAAWWIDRESDAAVVMVHGRRRGDRTEALRALPTALGRGASVLVTSYRNHDASAASPTGLFTYGLEEADDLVAALAWLRDRGIDRVALVGYSMGGAVALLARERWPASAPTLLGLAMDSPLIDARAVLRHGVIRSGVPFAEFAAGLGLAAAALRAGIRWGALDLRRLAPDLDVPVLLIGGVQDQTIPIALLDDFAAAAPTDRLRYWRVEDADHVEAYNVDPDGYEERLGAFIEAVLRR